MKTPDITPAQAKADAVLILGIASALGLKIDGQVSTWLTIAIIAAATVAHLVGYFTDAKLRGARARSAYEIGQAKLEAAYNDPVVTADKLAAILAGVERAIAAQSTKAAQSEADWPVARKVSTPIPITETKPGA